ncbi:MAG TPA: hypothetical protein VGW40_01360 [Allosphingosinicella sp.]|nr:hypothetical protein [Allosphingosinicella sp.]
MRLLFCALLVAAPLAAASLAAAPAPRAACRIALPAAPDAQSFSAAGRNGARAGALAQQTGTVFAAAASRLCASGALRAAHFARYRRLLVRNAEGADNPNIYDDAEEQPGALIIEYAFADGPAPAQGAVEAALRCWRNPNAAGCSEEDVGP